MSHDYLLLYARKSESWTPNALPRTEEQDERYKNPDNDPRGDWTSSDLTARNYYGEGTYAVAAPSGREIGGPPRGRYWAVSKQNFDRLAEENRIWWGPDGDNMPRLKRFRAEVKEGITPETLWLHTEVGNSQEAKKELLASVEFASSEDVFETPKPTRLIRRVIHLATQSTSDDIVLDFFAGSGTTGHAVMAQNAADGGNRRFVLVQLPEPTGRADYPTIADLTAERLRRAGAKIKAEHAGTLAGAAAAGGAAADAAGLDTGFRVFKLDSANVKAWEMPTTDTLTSEAAAQLIAESVDAVKPDRTPADLLWGAMLNLGLPLDGRVETRTVADQTVYVAGSGTLMACFDAAIDLLAGEALAIGLAGLAAERQVTGELTVLLLDKAFGGHDAAKVNLVENLKQRVPVSVTGVRVRSI